MVRHALKTRRSPRQAATRLAAIQALVTLGDDEEDLDSTTTALRLLGVSDRELDAALATPNRSRARAS